MIRMLNTLTGEKEPVSPFASGEISLYVCGVTVYAHCHLGHARSAIIFDVIRNYLEYKGYSVRYVKNYTDIDDKIIQRAKEEQRDWTKVAEQHIQSYEEDMSRLGVRPPTLAPRATDHIPEMIQVIEVLLAKGYAYRAHGGVYFEVEKFLPYGKLSKQQREEMVSGARVAVDEHKKSPVDFALWKASEPEDPAWPSPWGMGRPGWHIECSAMAIHHLGATVDLHGGGMDLVFPHHENEMAQSEAYTGKAFVRCWLHHGLVTVNQEKMSKSLGNFFTLQEIFSKSPDFSDAMIAEIIRYYLLSAHYRSPIDFSDQSLKNAKTGLDHFYTLFQKLKIAPAPKKQAASKKLQAEFEMAMADDFNTVKAIGILQTLRAEANTLWDEGQQDSAIEISNFFTEIGKVFGLFQVPSSRWRFRAWDNEDTGNALDLQAVEKLIEERKEARQNKDWKKSDVIRASLIKAGVMIEDMPDGTTRIKR